MLCCSDEKGGVTVALPSSGIINSIVESNADFSQLGPWLDSVYETVISNTTILGIWDKYITSNAFISVNLKLILLALALLVTFYGRKLADPIRFITAFVVSFCLSVCYVAPLLDVFVVIEHWIIPLVIASICAILCRYIYVSVLAAAVIYPVYSLIMDPALAIPYVGGNVAMAVILGIAAFIVFLIFRKHIERFGYSLIGGFLAAEIIRRFYDYTTLLPKYSTLLILLVTLIISISGFVFQEVNSRKKCSCDCHK